MQAEVSTIVELAIVVAGGFVGALVARALRLPVLVGYLAVGVLLGPSGFAQVRDSEFINAFAELGVILLLFAIGVELSLEALLRTKSASFAVGPLQIVLTMGLGYGIGQLLGWNPEQAVVLGFCLALSSTMVIVKLLSERDELHTQPGAALVAVSIVQDLASVLMVAAIAAFSGGEAMVGPNLLRLLIKGIAFLIWTIALARWVIPFVLAIVVRSYSREIFVLAVAVFCLGGAASAYLLGFSLALGAFVAGLVVTESRYGHEVLSNAAPFRDLFSMVFFVSLGFLLDLNVMGEHLEWTIILLVAAIFGKAILGAASALVGRYHLRNALAIGFGLAQIGEFSFLVATLARRQELLTSEMHSIIVGVAGLSLLSTPAALRLSDFIYSRLRTAMPPQPSPRPAAVPVLRNHVILCGYGRVGRLVGEALQQNGHPFAVVDYDQHIVAELQSHKVSVLYGDASSPVLLAAAGAPAARLAIVALPDRASTRLAVRELRRKNPSLPIIARVHLSEEVEATYEEGASEVVYAEFEASLEILRHALLWLGETPGKVQPMVDSIRRGRYRRLRRNGEEE